MVSSVSDSTAPVGYLSLLNLVETMDVATKLGNGEPMANGCCPELRKVMHSRGATRARWLNPSTVTLFMGRHTALHFVRTLDLHNPDNASGFEGKDDIFRSGGEGA